MKNRTGDVSQAGPHTSIRIVSSTCVIVPKKRKPATHISHLAVSATMVVVLTLKPHDRGLFGDLFDVRAMCARAANGRHEGLAGMEGADTAPLVALNHEEDA